MDINYAIRKSEPPKGTEESTPAEVALFERWERSNRLSVIFIKTKITTGIRGFVGQYDKVQNLLKAISEQFITLDKALASTLIMNFSSMRIISVKGVSEPIMQMRDIAAQLKKLEIDMSKSSLVHFILNTLPHHYRPFKISYNTHKDKWSINELMTICVQEEKRLVIELGESVMFWLQLLGRTKGMTRLKVTLLNQIRRGKVEYHLKLISRRKISVSFVKGRDT